MTAPPRVAIFGAAMVAVLGMAFGIGQLTNSDESDSVMAGESLPGLLPTQSGYTLSVDDTTFEPERAEPFAFRIIGASSDALQNYDEVHERELHLVIVRKDLSIFQHLHPTRDSEGRWTVSLTLSQPGTYRAYADFQPQGANKLTLGIDLLATGDATVATRPPVSTQLSVDGYEVTRRGELQHGESSKLTFEVRRNGQPTSLEPYLGANGHLVVIRESDLAYLHVHPTGDAPSGEVSFVADAPSPGSYRMFLDFQHEGTVRNASFAINTTTVAGASTDGEHSGH